jgi:hypothetical protein
MDKKILLSGRHRSISIINIDSSTLEAIYSSGLTIKDQSWQLWLTLQNRETVQGFIDDFEIQVNDEIYSNDIQNNVENIRILRSSPLIVFWESNIISYEYLYKNKFNPLNLSINKEIIDFGDNSETYDFLNVTYSKNDFKEIYIRNIDTGLFLVDPEEGVVDLSVKHLNDDDDEDGFLLFVD